MSKNSPKSNPIIVGLTGGIGSGKSIVARVFATLGVPIFDSDREGKRLLAEDSDIRRGVIDLFGSDAYRNDAPDREFLAKAVFSDPEKRKALNDLIHPAVRKSFKKFVAKHTDKPYVINEAAILVETGSHRHMDVLILVTAPEPLRIERVRHRDKVSSEMVKARMDAQWSDDKKRNFAEFTIENDNKNPVIPAVLQIHRALLRAGNESQTSL